MIEPEDTNETAQVVMQAVLDKLTQAIWSFDLDLMRENTCSPHVIHTRNEILTFRHEDPALERALYQLHSSLREMKVSDYVRSVTRARFAAPDIIEGQYRCWFLRDMLDVFPSFDAHMILLREDGRFRMKEARNNVTRGQWPMLGGEAEPEAASPSTPAAPFTQAEFRAFLRDITQPFLDRKIDTWAARMALPFSIVTSEGPVTLLTPGDVERNFNMYLKAVDAMELDSIHRVPLNFDVCDGDAVMVTYRTEFLKDGKRADAPYTATALLKRTTDGWKMSSILNARGHHRWTGDHPNPQEGKTKE